MPMKLLNQLQELQSEGIISPQTALDIQGYFNSKADNSGNRQMVIFSVIGSLLLGLGLVLLFAHNWDEMSKITKTIIAISPLVIAQGFGVYFLARKKDSLAGREGIGSLLFLCIGLSISLVGQIYNISGDMPGFLKSWMLLALPALFLLRSSMIAFLSSVGITWYILIQKDNSFYPFLMFLGYMALIIFHFYKLLKSDKESNYINIATWIIPITFLFSTAAFEKSNDELVFLNYLILGNLFTWIGNSKLLAGRSLVKNGLKVIGPLSILNILFILSFIDVSEDLLRIETNQFGLEWIAFCLLLIPLVFIIIKRSITFGLSKSPILWVFIPGILLFLFSGSEIVISLAANFMILSLGLIYILNGIKENLIGKLNFGLLIITILVTCRFFDGSMSFIARGIIFLILGAGFLATNYWIIKRKKHEHQ